MHHAPVPGMRASTSGLVFAWIQYSDGIEVRGQSRHYQLRRTCRMLVYSIGEVHVEF